MASTEEIAAEILEPMRSLYRVPFGIEEPERALAEYAKVLKMFPILALKTAWAAIVQGHKKKDWPTIADIVAAIRVSGDEEVRDLWDLPEKRPHMRTAQLWLQGAGLYDEYKRLPITSKVMIWRLTACLMLEGGTVAFGLDNIAGRAGEPWQRLARLVDHANGRRDCWPQTEAGWFPPKAKAAAAE